ncbi:hypothetical protein LXA43DRAFT_1113827 [Ganoderma leucocontextum]|nr:hypothetical protein LXA43DRAFT_1113827 [Ganoderma leucocontextum]
MEVELSEPAGQLRASCPVYGTTFSGQARPLPRANKLNYVRRKQREREAKEKAKANASRSEGGDEGQAGGSARKRAQGRKNSSPSGGTLPPALAGAATTPTTAQPALTDPTTPSDERVHTALVPQVVYYHSWSIYEPPTPAVPVDQHLPTAPAYTVPDPTYYQPLAPMGTYEHHTVGAHNSCLQLGSQPPHATTVGPSSSPDATYAVDDAYIVCSPAAIPDPQTNNGSPSTGSSPSPLALQAESRGVSVTPPSIHIASQLDPEPLTAQDSTNHFNAAYQDFHADTLQPAHNGPIPQAYPTEFTAAANALGGASTQGTTEQDFANAGPVSATQPESDQPVVWYAPPAAVAHVDRGRSYDIERGANDGYDTQIQYPPLAPPAMSTYEGHMHPSPPAPLSSYSELAQALQYPPRDFVDDCIPSSANGLGTASRTTASAEPNMPLYIHTSNGGVGVHSPGPVFLTPPYPQDVVISEDECARIIQECFDYSEPLLSETSSLLFSLRADSFATGQARDASQQLLTTSTWPQAHL